MLRTAQDFLKLVARQRDRALYVFNLDKLDVLRQLKFEEFIYRNVSPISPNSAFFLVNNHGKERAVIFGLSGNPADFIRDFGYCKREKINLIKRFTGGGTVLIDGNAITSSFISSHSLAPGLKPNEICRWTFDNVYLPSKLFNDSFDLVDGDYVVRAPSSIPIDRRSSDDHLNAPDGNSTCFNSDNNTATSNSTGNRDGENPICYKNQTDHKDNTSFENHLYYKVGGNAQAYSRHCLVHHTSFIWNVSPLIEKVLLIPKKTPKYRDNRTHSDFLASLSLALRDRFSDKQSFSESLRKAVNLQTPQLLKLSLNYLPASQPAKLDSDFSLDDSFVNSCLDCLQRSNTSLLSPNSH